MEPTQRSALARLLNGLKREQHDYRPSLEVFPALNIEKLAGDMRLATVGAERGTREEPASGGVAFDDVENRIIERVEAEKNAAHGLLLDELRTYKERLSGLDFEGRFATMGQAAPPAPAFARSGGRTRRVSAPQQAQANRALGIWRQPDAQGRHSSRRLR